MHVRPSAAPNGIFFGQGNQKLGRNVLTFSRKAGLPDDGGTCPGATFGDGGCLGPGTVKKVSTGEVLNVKHICYFMRGHNSINTATGLYNVNSSRAVESSRALGAALDWSVRKKLEVEPGTREVLLRLHVGGDFDTVKYVQSWIRVLQARPWLLAWAYTHSWWIDRLRPHLEKLRKLPNIQLFASMDLSLLRGDLFNRPRVPPKGWRVAWEDREEVPEEYLTHAIICPEMRPLEDPKHLPSCVSCGWCFRNNPSRELSSKKRWPMSVTFNLHW